MFSASGLVLFTKAGVWNMNRTTKLRHLDPESLSVRPECVVGTTRHNHTVTQ